MDECQGTARLERLYREVRASTEGAQATPPLGMAAPSPDEVAACVRETLRRNAEAPIRLTILDVDIAGTRECPDTQGATLDIPVTVAMTVSTNGLGTATRARLDHGAGASVASAVATLALRLVGVERTLEHIDDGRSAPADDLQRAMLATDTGRRWPMPDGEWALSAKGARALGAPKRMTVHQIITEGGFFTEATRARARTYRARHTAAVLSAIVPGTKLTVRAGTLAQALETLTGQWTREAATIAGTTGTRAALAAHALIERQASAGTTAAAARAQRRTAAVRARLARARAFQHAGEDTHERRPA